ncbi:MAG: hypothetical protein ACI9BD_001006, partial [Candidatus Marinamargulisbacteria bacterium]
MNWVWKSLSELPSQSDGLVIGFFDMCGSQPMTTGRTWVQTDGFPKLPMSEPLKVVRRLYSGCAPMYISYAPGLSLTLLQQKIYKPILKGMGLSDDAAHIGASAGAGFGTGMAWVNMCDRMMILQQMSAREGLQTPLLQVVKQTLSREGVRGLTRGALPTSIRESAYATLVLAGPTVKRAIFSKENLQQYPWSTTVLASGLLGFGGASATNLADVWKTNVQARHYTPSSTPKLSPWEKGVDFVKTIKRVGNGSFAKGAFRGSGFRGLGYTWS